MKVSIHTSTFVALDPIPESLIPPLILFRWPTHRADVGPTVPTATLGDAGPTLHVDVGPPITPALGRPLTPTVRRVTGRSPPFFTAHVFGVNGRGSDPPATRAEWAV